LTWIIQHLNCILYFLNLVFSTKTLSTENSLEYYPFSDNYLVNLLKNMKKKQTLSRSARSPVERVLLFLAYIPSECAVVSYSALCEASRYQMCGGEVTSDILNSDYSLMGIYRQFSPLGNYQFLGQELFQKPQGGHSTPGYGNTTVFSFLTSLQKNDFKTGKHVYD